jgi:hypothetical protein
MATFSVKYEDGLEGPSNIVSWNCWVYPLLEDHDLWDFIEKLVVEPIDLVLLVEHKKMAKNK